MHYSISLFVSTEGGRGSLYENVVVTKGIFPFPNLYATAEKKQKLVQSCETYHSVQTLWCWILRSAQRVKARTVLKTNPVLLCTNWTLLVVESNPKTLLNYLTINVTLKVPQYRFFLLGFLTIYLHDLVNERIVICSTIPSQSIAVNVWNLAVTQPNHHRCPSSSKPVTARIENNQSSDSTAVCKWLLLR